MTDNLTFDGVTYLDADPRLQIWVSGLHQGKVYLVGPFANTSVGEAQANSEGVAKFPATWYKLHKFPTIDSGRAVHYLREQRSLSEDFGIAVSRVGHTL